MKTLILTCNTGEGHNSTATAICDAFAAHGQTCNRADTLAYLSPHISRIVCRWHSRIYRYMPRAFDAGYRAAEEHPDSFQKKSVLYRILTRGVDKLYAFLIKEGYDTIICTHAFSALLVTALKEKYPSLCLHTSFVATDYTCSPSVKECEMDAFFIPDSALSDDFICKGVPADRVYGTGLPVRRVFLETLDRAAAKEACGLPIDGRHVLMMCGSMGCGPMEALTAKLAKTSPADVIISVVCGTNKKLFRKLSRKFYDHPNVQILGYVNNIPALMDASELYLTKPGGISITEALAKRLPMILIHAVAGCEEYNLQYLLDRGMAKTAQSPEALCDLCLSLLNEPTGATLDAMRKNMDLHTQGNAGERLYTYITAQKGDLR